MKRFVMAAVASVTMTCSAFAADDPKPVDIEQEKDSSACHETATMQIPDGDEAAWNEAYSSCMKAHGHMMEEEDSEGTAAE